MITISQEQLARLTALCYRVKSEGLVRRAEYAHQFRTKGKECLEFKVFTNDGRWINVSWSTYDHELDCYDFLGEHMICLFLDRCEQVINDQQSTNHE